MKTLLLGALLGTLAFGARAETTPPTPDWVTRHIEAQIAAIELTLDHDFAIYMESDCPQEVRQAALRQLWRLMHPDAVEGEALM
jgi:hypothetical protein